MFNDKEGPIEHFSWGKFIVSGETHADDGFSWARHLLAGVKGQDIDDCWPPGMVL